MVAEADAVGIEVVKPLDRSPLGCFVLGWCVVWSGLHGREVGRGVRGLGADHDAFVIGVDDDRLMTWSVAGSRDDANSGCDLPVPVDLLDGGTGKVHPFRDREVGLVCG